MNKRSDVAKESGSKRRKKLTSASLNGALQIIPISLADEIISGVNLPRESLEGATIFRSLGDWNAIRGRWDKAADRFEHFVGDRIAGDDFVRERDGDNLQSAI